MIDVPEDGEVRLYKSTTTPSIYYGRLLVYMSDVWGKVKGSWTYANARVVCRQMGYNLTRKYICRYFFNPLFSNYASSLSYISHYPLIQDCQN